jgi:Zn-dependent protease with chaperone function
MTVSFDFQHYIETRKAPQARRTHQGGFGEYIYAGDYRVLRTMARLHPVRLSVEASVRAFKAWRRSDILGSSVRVSARQFPRLYTLVADCAQQLHIPVPAVYVYQNLTSINAGAYGTDTDAFILVNSATVDRLNDAELKFVIGHECGHIQNSHVTYRTALSFLTDMTGAVVRSAAAPARVALMGWSRRAEITCDRAGLLCCGDLKVATSTLVKTAVGSQRMVDQIDVEAYLEQLQDIRQGWGRLSELFLSHPYLPKRLKALQAFAESEYWLRSLGQPGGRPLADVDRDVDDIIRVL